MKTFIQALAINSLFILSAQTSSLDNLPEIKYESFKLDNGLTVIVHEDKKVPMVAAMPINHGVNRRWDHSHGHQHKNFEYIDMQP